MTRLTKLDKATIRAFERGYRVNRKGEVVSPTGNVRSCYVKQTSASLYPHCTFNVRFGEEIIPVPFAKLLAYQKFGREAFARGIVTRHKNGKSLDNRPSNVTIGTRHDNAMDIPKVKRVKLAKKAAKASAKARKKKGRG
jgi:hypothetical protein